MEQKKRGRPPGSKNTPKNHLRKGDGQYRSPDPNKHPRPKTADDLIKAISEERLDRRLKEVRQIAEVKRLLSVDPVGVAQAILRHDIACNIVITKALMDHAQANRASLVDEHGALPPALSKDFLGFQAATTKAIQTLMKLEERRANTPLPVELDVASIVLECEPAGGQGGDGAQ